MQYGRQSRCVITSCLSSEALCLRANAILNLAFALQGDGVKNSAALIPELLDDGIRLLVYAGNAGTRVDSRINLVLMLSFRLYVQRHRKLALDGEA